MTEQNPREYSGGKKNQTNKPDLKNPACINQEALTEKAVVKR